LLGAFVRVWLLCMREEFVDSVHYVDSGCILLGC